MSFKIKFSFEEKEKIIMEYLNGINGFRETTRLYNVSQTSIRNWIRLYKTFGTAGLKARNVCSSYSAEIKQNAVSDYLSYKLSIPDILIKYKIRSATQLRRWVMKYNGHEELKTSGTGGAIIMTKGRETTYEERIEIVRYCIEHQNNYAETAQKFQVSYQQVYTWINKYEKDGVEALQDRRGKRKSEDEMSEIEKLKAQNKLLEARNRKQQMEIDFLKKLNEIERRRY